MLLENNNLNLNAPKQIDASKIFGISKKIMVPYFSQKSDLVPEIDDGYVFDDATTTSILMGFKYNKKVLIQGLHGTGKSSHIEQISARLNWPCVRINLDGHISRFDLLGKDGIVLEGDKQVTTFKEGLLPWAIKNPVALVFDEYDAGRPDVMFVIQRVLEAEGKLTLLDQNTIITPNRYFRIFGTCNTLGLGDTSGLYYGTQNLNQGQLDRWNIFCALNFLKPEIEERIIKNKMKKSTKKIHDSIPKMVLLANLVRDAFKSSEISVIMSPRTCIMWAENFEIFGDIDHAFKLSFLNKCDSNDQKIINEFYQRCFGRELITNIE
tara:strand:- start:751 stop:1719 length:969 start_codon:yes stop_codon:yes gene_type:complete